MVAILMYGPIPSLIRVYFAGNLFSTTFVFLTNNQMNLIAEGTTLLSVKSD